MKLRNLDRSRAFFAFVTVAECESFSEAGRRLGVTPSAVSQSVAGLERTARTRLLHRTTRKVSLTEAGARLYQRCRGPLISLQAALEELTDQGDDPAGELRVSVPISFGRLYVVPLLSELRTRYPHLGVTLSFTDRVTDLVGEGFDVGIRGGVFPESGMVSRKIAPLPLIVCATPEYLESHGRPRTLEDLAKRTDCIQYRFPTSSRIFQWRFQVQKKEAALAVTGPLVFDEPEAVCAAALCGLGIAQVDGNIAAAHLRAGRLEAVLTRYSISRYMYAYYPARPHLPPKVRVFIDGLTNYLKAHPDLNALSGQTHRRG